MMKERLEGVLPVRKPAGWTSHDVVAKARRILGVKRIGHTGTLDPQVTGVLPLCVGRATRFVEYLQEQPKEYEAELVIGIATDTEDLTGDVVERTERVELDERAVRDAIASFVGEIEQVPPMYSAVKVDGKRLYEMAREGKEVERKPRKVTIYRIDLLDLNLKDDQLGLPVIRFRASCSKGTYIRTLCVDIGRRLGYPAAMKSLIRTRTGSFGLDDCYTLEEIASLKESGALEGKLTQADKAASHLPEAELSDEQAKAALQGRVVRARDRLAASLADASDGAIVRAYGQDGRFIGLLQWKKNGHLLGPHKIFSDIPETSV